MSFIRLYPDESYDSLGADGSYFNCYNAVLFW